MGHLILLRHGQSVWNQMDVFTGWVDIPLSNKGIEQALEAGRQLKGHAIDMAFTSTLIRAQMTLFLALSESNQPKTPVIQHQSGAQKEWAEIYNEAVKSKSLPVYEAWELNERMYGELQGKNKEHMRQEYGVEQVQLWRRSYDVAPPHGESLKMTKERTLPYFNQHIRPLVASGHTVLVTAHGNSLRSIIMELQSLTPEQVVSLEIPLGTPLFYDLS
jgi:2,3-bisphosphoglycerate-dependent phosphoglycerate mutase